LAASLRRSWVWPDNGSLKFRNLWTFGDYMRGHQAKQGCCFGIIRSATGKRGCAGLDAGPACQPVGAPVMRLT
jgi:hypothetical protein